MGLEKERLTMAREIGGGTVQAQCPACAENGSDKKGQHLRVYPDGRFGCCVYPKDSEHRKRIFALVGDRKPRTFTVRVVSRAAAETGRSVRESLSDFSSHDFGTLGTAISNPRAYAREEASNIIESLKDWETCVPSVPAEKERKVGSEESRRLPFLMADGTLVIPFDSPEHYHWWKGGQSVKETIAELLANSQQARTEEENYGTTI